MRAVAVLMLLLVAAAPLPAQRRFSLPAGARVVRDLAYGPMRGQRLDVYLPAHPVRAPILFMVHGGAWAVGDKTSAGVVAGKVRHWLPLGYIVVSVNYRMIPDVTVGAEAEDVARALAWVQSHAREWGGDGDRIIMMGHSAGGHLVALVTADSALVRRAGARPWLGTIGLDAGAYNVMALMRAPHLGLYDRAFGKDPDLWRALSPALRLDHAPVPLLLVCSSRRVNSCPQAEAFAAAARAHGGTATVLPINKTHAQIDADLGTDPGYTRSVEAYLKGIGLG
jgi:acetyl esterase/lipase